jgi:hypothetical protein
MVCSAEFRLQTVSGERDQPKAWVILGIDSRLSIVLYVGMPRKLRLEYSGAIYHVMSRGDRREKIYLDDVDRQDFIKTLAEACQKTNWQVHAKQVSVLTIDTSNAS